jgi:predicted phage-related endonuclease
MSLTAEQLSERRTRIGGSDAGKIVAGDWRELWELKTGRRADEDLSWVLPVQIGVATEQVNLAFFEHATGHRAFGRGEVYTHPDHPFIGTTLDGLVLIEGRPAIVQCKHVNPFAKIEEIEQRYYPQVSHEMLATGASLAFLSVILGTQKHEIIEVHRDREYTTRLLELETEFWKYVADDIAPPDKDPLQMPVKVEAKVIYNMDGNNAWSMHAGDWLATYKEARSFEIASKELKKLVPADAARCHGYGIAIDRNRAGSLTIRREA